MEKRFIIAGAFFFSTLKEALAAEKPPGDAFGRKQEMPIDYGFGIFLPSGAGELPCRWTNCSQDRILAVSSGSRFRNLPYIQRKPVPLRYSGLSDFCDSQIAEGTVK